MRGRNARTTDSNPGLANLGFFGGVTSGVRCDADDDSFLCELTKFTSIITQLVFLISILAMVFFVLRVIIMPMLFSKSSNRGGTK